MPTNYPAALDSFTTKVDGVDDVMAADINKLQDAILALQTKLGANGSDVVLRAATGSSDTPDILFQDGSGSEVGRIWKDPTQARFLCRFGSGGTAREILNQANLNYFIGATAAHGAVGTYAMLTDLVNRTTYQGELRAGGELAFAAADGFVIPQQPAGTWKCMGLSAANASFHPRTTVWVRVA